MLARDEVIADERFKDNATRVIHRDELTLELEATLKTETTATWLQRFSDVGVPATEIMDIDQVLDSEQVDALGMIQTHSFSRGGTYRTLGAPLRLDHVALDPRGASPELGADTDAVLAELGLDRATIDDLRARGVIGRRS